MKNNKKAIDIINNMDIDLPLSKEEENARTYKSVIKSINENKEQKRFVGKRVFATALAAVLVFVLSFYAVAAIVESTMDISVPDKIAAFFDNSYKIKYKSKFTILPKEISQSAKNEIKAVNDAGGKCFENLQQLNEYLDIDLLENSDFKRPQFLDNKENIILIYTSDDGAIGHIESSYQYKDYAKVCIECSIAFAIDKPQSYSRFYLTEKDIEGNAKINDYISDKNGLNAKIYEHSKKTNTLGIHFIHDDIAYNITVINNEGLDNDTLAKAIIDSFTTE